MTTKTNERVGRAQPIPTPSATPKGDDVDMVAAVKPKWVIWACPKCGRTTEQRSYATSIRCVDRFPHIGKSIKMRRAK